MSLGAALTPILKLSPILFNGSRVFSELLLQRVGSILLMISQQGTLSLL